jgi:hypothetical protein
LAFTLSTATTTDVRLWSGSRLKAPGLAASDAPRWFVASPWDKTSDQGTLQRALSENRSMSYDKKTWHRTLIAYWHVPRPTLTHT